MRFLLRKVPFSDRRCLLRILALGSVGSGLFFSNYGTDSRTSVSISVPAPLRESMGWPWRNLLEQTPNPSFVSLDQTFQHRILPLIFSRTGTDPSSDVKKEVSVGIGDSSKGFNQSSNINKGSTGGVGDVPRHCCNCLGRDTIANASAKIGPAVVNLSVP